MSKLAIEGEDALPSRRLSICGFGCKGTPKSVRPASSELKRERDWDEVGLNGSGAVVWARDRVRGENKVGLSGG